MQEPRFFDSSTPPSGLIRPTGMVRRDMRGWETPAERSDSQASRGARDPRRSAGSALRFPPTTPSAACPITCQDTTLQNLSFP